MLVGKCLLALSQSDMCPADACVSHKSKGWEVYLSLVTHCHFFDTQMIVWTLNFYTR